jgi:hypothetical protein
VKLAALAVTAIAAVLLAGGCVRPHLVAAPHLNPAGAEVIVTPKAAKTSAAGAPTRASAITISTDAPARFYALRPGRASWFRLDSKAAWVWLAGGGFEAALVGTDASLPVAGADGPEPGDRGFGGFNLENAKMGVGSGPIWLSITPHASKSAPLVFGLRVISKPPKATSGPPKGP